MSSDNEATLARRVVRALDLPTALTAGGAFDKYALQSHPDLLRDVAAGMGRLPPVDAEVFGGLELAGVPLAAAMALADGRPFAVVRRGPKPGSSRVTAAGAAVAGKRVLLIKDMVRSDAALSAVADVLRAEGAVVTHVVRDLLGPRSARHTRRRRSRPSTIADTCRTPRGVERPSVSEIRSA